MGAWKGSVRVLRTYANLQVHVTYDTFCVLAREHYVFSLPAAAAAAVAAAAAAT